MTLREDQNYVLGCIDLAIRANGGDRFRHKWCECEPEIGYAPCMYCAIYNGLRAAKEYVQMPINELEYQHYALGVDLKIAAQKYGWGRVCFALLQIGRLKFNRYNYDPCRSM